MCLWLLSIEYNDVYGYNQKEPTFPTTTTCGGKGDTLSKIYHHFRPIAEQHESSLR